MAGIDNNTLLYLRGDNFKDLSLNSKTVTNAGATIVNGGKFGKCMEFNNHIYTKVDIPLNYTFNSDFTISAYCNLLKNGTSSCYLLGSKAENNEIYFAVDKNGCLCVAFHNSSSQIITSAEKIPLNKIVHIAFVRKSGTLKCYIDGRCVGTVSYSGSPKITTSNLHGGVNTVWQMSSLELSSVARWEGDFTPPTRPYNSININITNKDLTKADFNISKLGQEAINKVEIYQNGDVKQTFTDSYDNLTFNHGGKNFKIVVTYDDNYTEEQEINIGNSKAKIYLYREGVEYIPVVADYMGSSSNTLTKNSNNLTMYSKNSSTLQTQFSSFIFDKIFTNFKFKTTVEGRFLPRGQFYLGCTDIKNVSTYIDSVDFKNEGSDSATLKLTYDDYVDNTYIKCTYRCESSTASASFEVYNVYLETEENVISINSQMNNQINFNCNTFDNLIAITKAEIYINGALSKTYTSNFNNITYNIDNTLCTKGNNQIKIKVAYTQGDGIYETVEEVLIYTSTEKGGLPTTSSLKELIDRQELLTNSIEIQKNTLKSILESKNVEVSDSVNKLSILIQKVDELGEIIPPLYLYKEGDECINLTGGFIVYKNNSNATPVGIFSKNTDYLELDATKGYASCGTTNKINVSEYKTLYIDSSTDTSNAICCLTTAQNLVTSNRVVVMETTKNGRGVTSIDISNVNDLYYLAIGLGTSLTKVHKIWLEK